MLSVEDSMYIIDSAPTVDAVPADAVKRLRETQKRYFKTRDPELLRESKQLEKELDALIENMDTVTVQGRLF